MKINQKPLLDVPRSSATPSRPFGHAAEEAAQFGMSKRAIRRTPMRRWFAVLATAAVLAGITMAQQAGDPLARGFHDPPESARPRVWWHWLNGNVTKEGITADLEWMKRSCIGGMQMFDGNVGTPQFVENRLVWMTPDWKDAFRHAGAEADRLGLEMAMAASGGWSETAGPWVSPEQAMKKIVWSETVVEGPRRFSGVLAHPPTVNGKFQELEMPQRPESLLREPQGLPGAKSTPPPPPARPDPTFYRDIKVIAYRLPEGEVRMIDAHPRVTTNVSGANTALLTDGDFRRVISLEVPKGKSETWVQFEFPEPYRAAAITIVSGLAAILIANGIPQGEVQFSHDGTNWLTLVSLPGAPESTRGFPVQTYSFPETTAKFYRVVLRPWPANPFFVGLAESLGFSLPPIESIKLAEIELTGPRVNHWQGKAAFGNAIEFRAIATPEVPKSATVGTADVVDLTARMQLDGAFDWAVPRGKWAILRFGYSLTGEKNHPATAEATGYEVDKLSAKHVEDYASTYVHMVSDALGPFFAKSFRYFLMDSWEAGVENWTDEMIAEFQKRRGYDPTPYLPVLTGRIVDNAQASDAFLWDFRRTIADLLAENHYGEATKYFKEHGVGLYAEAMGIGAPTTGDGLLNKSFVTIPMAEFWTANTSATYSADQDADLREAASAAHIYGKPFAAAESFTTAFNAPVWASPYYLKPFGDHALALGINRFVFHTSDQQPFVDDHHKPGMTLGPFGQHYTRNTTWANQAIAWNTYLARCSYMLQQGSFVADLAYFYGEGAPATVPYWKQVTPAVPDGYGYDWINADVLMNRMSVRDGRLVLASGMSYRVLVLPDFVDEITLPALRKISELVAAGATVIAPRPQRSPSLADMGRNAEFASIVNEVWRAVDGMGVTEHGFGKGKIYWGKPLQQVLQLAGVSPDVRYNRPQFDSRVDWIHRRTTNTDIYFVANQQGRAEDLEVSFRVDGKDPELWDPDTGTTQASTYRIEGVSTTVALHFDPFGSTIVVFRKPAPAPSRTLPQLVRTELQAVSGPWHLTFPLNWGAPPEIDLDQLISWTASSDAGVKYFSGTAKYAKDIGAPASWFGTGARLVLDLGMVKEIAEAAVNGRSIARILWKPPFEVDITDALKPGANHLEIEVTNLWPNRIIGDRQTGATTLYAWLDYRPFKAKTPLIESGLLGPVKIVMVSSK